MSLDPEDNVRYVVKWKGLPYAEVTWEYWRDIKRDAVDEAEDFWYRQQPPDLELMRQCANRPHPHMRDFKKLQQSPAYGVSTKPRPVAKVEQGDDTAMSIAYSDPGFRLRSYQLEGVNWLLFNWWNRRSCILADEMGLG
jgi:SNF2 family DNA or RNA helicase